jgi:hypothetical protein
MEVLIKELMSIVLENNITTINFELDENGLIDLQKTFNSVEAEIKSKSTLKEIDTLYNKCEALSAQSLLQSLDSSLNLGYTPIFIKNYNRRISFMLS